MPNQEPNSGSGGPSSSDDFLAFVRQQREGGKKETSETPNKDTPADGKDNTNPAEAGVDIVEAAKEFNDTVKKAKKGGTLLSNFFQNVANGYNEKVRPYVSPVWNYAGRPLLNFAKGAFNLTAGMYLKAMRGLSFPQDKETGDRNFNKKGFLTSLGTTAALVLTLWMGTGPALQFGSQVAYDTMTLPSQRIEYVYTNGMKTVNNGDGGVLRYEVPTSTQHPGEDGTKYHIAHNIYHNIWTQRAEEMAVRIPDETGFSVMESVGWRFRLPGGVINMYPEIVDHSSSAVSLLPAGHPAENGRQVTDQSMADWINGLSTQEVEQYRDTNMIPDYLIKHLESEGLLNADTLNTIGSISFNMSDIQNPDGSLAWTFNNADGEDFVAFTVDLDTVQSQKPIMMPRLS